MDLAPKKNKKKKETGRWTKEEHSRFILGLVNYGKNWKKVEELVGTRTGAQVRSHAQKFFNRLSKVKQDFYEQTEAEQEATIKAALTHPEFAHETSELSGHKVHPDPKPQDEETYTDEESADVEEKQIKISPRILEIIKQESEDGTKPIEYKKFMDAIDQEAGKLQTTISQKKTSEQFKEEVKGQVENLILEMEQERMQFKNLAFLLIAYIALHGEQLKHEDESFFQKLIKCQNRYICYNRFLDLVDLPKLTPRQNREETPNPRKKSFTLYDQSDEFKEQIGNVQKMIKPAAQQDMIIIPTAVRQVQNEREEENTSYRNETLGQVQSLPSN